jgi:para-aminobenzoate synthetase component I
MKAHLCAHPFIVNGEYSSTEVFSSLADEAWSMWLDSCDSDHVDSRFDIVVFDPLVTIKTTGNSTEINDMISGICEQSTADPLQLVEQAKQKIFNNIDIEISTLPFHGGAVGYFSYDLGRAFEKLPELAEKDIHAPDMAVGLYNKAIVYDRHEAIYFLVCLDSERQRITEALHQKITTSITPQSFELTSTWQSNMTEKAYTEKFEQVQAYLLSGDCYQINLAQRFMANYQGSELNAYLKLREANKAPFSAFIKTDKNVVLSISPERFLRLDNGAVQTKPIKGTRPRHAEITKDIALAQSLKNASKDKAENLMIVDLLRNDLSRVCEAGTVKVPSLFAIESFPAVHHLVSTVEGKLSEGKTGVDLLRAAFPGGSITGAPKIRAMEIIEELEPHRRSVYCGSIGYLSACGKMDSSITIRTLICEDGKIYCWAGGGLVADSKVKEEYQETYDKVGKILPTLGNTQN